MSSKNKIAVLLFIAVAALSLWLYLRRSEGTIRKELYEFAVEDTSSITKIYMASQGGRQVTLEKTKPGYWQVDGKYKARPDAIKHLLMCIKDLRVRNPVAKSAVETISRQLATSGTKVEIYSGENLIKLYYVGADTQDGLGTFMLLADAETGKNSTTPFVMFIPGFNGFLSVRYFVKEEEWRDKSIFSFYPNDISSISVKYMRYPDSSFTISLSDKNEISLADNKGKNIADFDTLKVKQYITYYTNIQYESLKNDLRPKLKDSVLANGPVHVITLKDRQGTDHTAKTFIKPADSKSINSQTGKPDTEDLDKMFALVNQDKDMAVVQYYVFGKLCLGISRFMHNNVSARMPSPPGKTPGVKK